MGKRTKKRLERLYNEIVFERRILMLCTVFVGLSIAVWCISITTDYWFIVNGGNGIYVPSTKRYFYSSHSGIWRICRYVPIIIIIIYKVEPFNFNYINHGRHYKEYGKLVLIIRVSRHCPEVYSYF